MSTDESNRSLLNGFIRAYIRVGFLVAILGWPLLIYLLTSGRLDYPPDRLLSRMLPSAIDRNGAAILAILMIAFYAGLMLYTSIKVRQFSASTDARSSQKSNLPGIELTAFYAGFFPLFAAFVIAMADRYAGDRLIFDAGCGTPFISDYMWYVVDNVAKGAVQNFFQSFDLHLWRCAPRKGSYLIGAINFAIRSVVTYVVIVGLVAVARTLLAGRRARLTPASS